MQTEMSNSIIFKKSASLYTSRLGSQHTAASNTNNELSKQKINNLNNFT